MIDHRRKRKGKNTLNTGRNKERRMEVELNKYSQKRDDLRIPVEMWDRSSWSYEGERESGALNLLWNSML